MSANSASVIAGDCVAAMVEFARASLLVDAIVTDPPYGLEFMGKDWDKLDGELTQKNANAWKGRHGKSSSSIGNDDSKPASRHHVAFGIKKYGFKRCTKCGKRRFSGSPCICGDPAWVIEFPQQASLSALRMQQWHEAWAREAYRVLKPGGYLLAFGGTRTHHRIWCAIEDAGFVIQDTIMWLYGQGFPKGKTQLKPAFEPIIVAYKPGGRRELQIDEWRIPTGDSLGGGAEKRVAFEGKHEGWARPWMRDANAVDAHTSQVRANVEKAEALGRWPANVCHDGSDEVLAAFAAFGQRDSGGPSRKPPGHYQRLTTGFFTTKWAASGQIGGHQDTGTAARFFYCAKASKADRAGSKHPTIKPIALLRWLVRLVSPPDGLVLDPFAGSGTTGAAAIAEGRRVILIEREPEYLADIRRRLGLRRAA